MKLYNHGGNFNLRVVVTGGWYDISAQGTEVPNEVAELILKTHGDSIKKEPLKKKSIKEMKKNG